MATVLVHEGNYDIKLYIDYSFSSNTTNRTWSFSSSMYVYVKPYWNIGPWSLFANTDAMLRGAAIGNIGEGNHTIATYSTSGSYDDNGTAPGFTLTWAWDVNSSWGGFVFPKGSFWVQGDAIGANKVTINYNGNNGTPSKTSDTVAPGASVTLPSATRSGYTFNGWYTDPNNGTFVGNAGASYTVNSNQTIYAHWLINRTVTYNANGGNSTPSSQTVAEGTTITLPSAITKDNTDSTGTITLSYNANGGSGAPGSQNGTYTNTTPYSFGGWNTNSSGTGTNYGAGASYKVTESVTLYAKWNTGTTTRKSNPTLTVSSTVPTRTYYTFKGWSTNSGATSASYVGGNSITISDNTTLYAVWSPNPPTNLTITRTGGSTTSIDVSVSATGLTMTNYTLYYRVNGSTGAYSSKSLGTATTGSITGLQVDTNYQIYFTATNAGGTTTSSAVIYSTLLTNPTITTPTKKNTFPYMTTISATGSISPSRTLTYAFSKNGGSTWTDYQSSNSYHWTDLVPETTYSMGVRVKATKQGTNAVDTTATSYLTVTTPTDQVRFRIKDAGKWKKGRGYIKVNGTWKKGVRAFIKINGKWVENKNFYDGEPSLWD